MKKEGYKAIATLIGCIIGAGVLGIPYVVSKAGFLTGLLDIFLLGAAVLLINLFIGEVSLRTKGNHQLTGYAEKYLGKRGKIIMTISMVLGIYGALIAYIIGVGEALAAIFNYNAFVFSVGFFLVFAFLVYKGIRWVANSELIFTSVVIFLILAISLICVFSGKLELVRLSEFSLSKIFLPYGVILFAFIGAAAVPEMREILGRNGKEMKKAIFIASFIPLVLYALFAFAVIGVFGKNITEVATVGLGREFGVMVLLFANLFAVFAMSSSFLVLALALKEVYDYDYKLNHNLSWLLACVIPFLIFLLGVKSFIKVIGFTGVFAGGLEGVLIVLMLWKAKKKGERKPEYNLRYTKIVGIILIIIFGLGVIKQFV